MAVNSETEGSWGNSLPIIVGIGASAGGLQALESFLAELPQEFGFVIIFIQHFSSKHKSILPELLRSQRPDLDSAEITEGLEMLPGKIYFHPQGQKVTVQTGTFHLVPTHDEHGYPIDDLFVSLAREIRGRLIAVVLSGAGTDGARGVQEVKAAGGTVFVQDPATAGFTGMPVSAINTGQADWVLPPQDIARAILQICGPETAAMTIEDYDWPVLLESFTNLLYDKTGCRFNHYKKSVISRRISRRMKLLGISSVGDYLNILAERDVEAERLASDLMIGVTSFFRDRQTWKALNTEVLGKLIAKQDAAPIRVWTPACATGEEAYSIAMLLKHELDLAGRKKEIQIFASDINDLALQKARSGIYPESFSADIPSDYIGKFFIRSGSALTITVNADLRQQIVFAKHDMLSAPPFSRMDLIICRNFLIYLEPDAQEKIISLFHYALNDGGYLFLGNAESLGSCDCLFDSIGNKKDRIYRKVKRDSALKTLISIPLTHRHEQLFPLKSPQAAAYGPTITETVQKALIKEYAPAAVAIGRNFEILYYNGPMNRYIRQPEGAPTQNLLEMLPDGLRNRVRGGIYRAANLGKPVLVRTSAAEGEGRKKQLTLRIEKLSENLFLIAFLEKGVIFPEPGAVHIDTAGLDETALRQLENELCATREDLQSHIEQLESLGEELQSSNEELQASNEEMVTSREELQSLNEELLAVNAQLQEKIEEQNATNDDLLNFLASTDIPTIFLDRQFRVKRFTPAMTRLAKLLPADLGRPIIDLSQEGLGQGLDSDIRSVFDSAVPVRKEIALGDSWYVRTALPYTMSDGSIGGVVVTYNDLTWLKQAEETATHLASFPELNPNLVIEVNSAGEVIYCNPATRALLVELGFAESDVGALLPVDLNEILPELKEGAISLHEVPIKDRVYYESIHAIPQFNVARIYASDITVMKLAEKRMRDSEQLYRSLFDNMLNGFAYCKMIFVEGRPEDFIYIAVNDAFTKLTGLKDVVGKKVSEVIPGIRESDPELLSLYGRVALSGIPERFETYVKGLQMWFWISVFSPGKECFVAVFDVITERKMAEQALQESKDKMGYILNSTAEGIYGVDLDGNCTFCNPSAVRMLGYGDESELIGRNMHGLIHHSKPDGAPYPKEECVILNMVSRGERIHRDKEFLWRSDGKSFPAEFWAHPIFKDNDLIGMVVTFIDITERVALESQLLHAQKMEAVGTLAGGIAHDFNNMLSAIVGYSHLALGKLPQDDPLRADLNHILEAVDRAAALTRSLLAFSRKQTTTLDELDLKAVVGMFKKFLLRLIREDIALETAYTEDDLTVLADKGQIEQMLMNLATNARDAMPEGGRLRIELRKVFLEQKFFDEYGFGSEGDFALIEVSDTGIGMDEQTRTRIFEPFFTTKEQGTGTGLGLAIVYSIVKEHKGFINLSSGPGAGTTFRIYLPLIERGEKKAAGATVDHAVSSGGTEIVLLAEDDAVLRRVNATILRHYGYTVMEAADGAEAVSMFDKHREKIDLVILDGIMPVKNGREAYREIKALKPDIKCIFISGYAEHIFTKDGVPDSGATFLVKPIAPELLLGKIRDELKR